MYAQGAPAATIQAQTTYSYERAEHASVTRAYGEMTIGLLVTAAVAILTQATGAYIALIQSLGVIGAWAPFVVEIVIAIYLGARIEKMKSTTARVMFYVYAAIMGFTLSTIFMAYDLGTIGISLALCAGFFFALTMFGMTTKVNMLKAGPILLVGLIVLIIAEVLLMIFAPGRPCQDRLRHRPDAVRRHDRLRRPGHARAVRRVRRPRARKWSRRSPSSAR